VVASLRFSLYNERMLNVAVLGSGRGSNFKAVLDAMTDGRISGARTALVLSNNSTAGILEIARAHAIPAVHLSQKQYASEEKFGDALLDLLRSHDTGLVVLAGYMKRLPARVVAAYRHRIINVHPALLPDFGGQGMFGIHVHEAVLAAHRTVSGATVHIVDEEYDHGAIVVQEQVPVLPDDTPSSLADRVLQVEHRILPRAIQLFARERVIVSGGKISIRPSQE
jgi:formyltetrahydrofolate-dependent phosphoribosylglycinamide formyltransferase